MARRPNRLYLHVRRFVDHDLATRPKPVTPVYGLLFALIMVPFHHFGAPRPVLAVGWSLAIVLAVAWTVFVCWRCWRVLSAVTVKDDRHFDREGKFDLPPEYWTTESLTRSRRKRGGQNRTPSP